MLTDKDKEMLIRSCDLQEELDRLRECLRELELQTVGSPRTDGMPRGSGGGDAMAGRVISKELLEQKIRTAERALKKSRAAGGKALRNVKAPLRMFCEAFYLEAASFEEALIYARINKRTAERYTAMINREDGGRE